ncbi:MAG: DUF4388 domain-containing protein [Thermoanaerobaculia bacterium]
MNKTFQYRGDLAETTLPEILHAIHRFQLPGIIEAQREGVVKKIYLKGGWVLHATSSDLQDSLGSFLLRTGRLTQPQYELSMQLRGRGERRLGALLVDLNFLSPAEVHQAIRDQIEAIVWSLFYWQEGEVQFQIGNFDEEGMVQLMLPMRQVILAGIKRAPNAKALVARLGNKDAVFSPSFQPEDLIDAGLDATDYALLRLVDGQRSLYETCSNGPLPPAESAKLMYAFQVLQFIRRAEAASLQPAEAPASTSTSNTGKVVIRLRSGGQTELKQL